MHIFVGILSLGLLFAILWDAFETVILPRRVTRTFRLARFYMRNAWLVYHGIVGRWRDTRRREAFLSYFGPLALLGLFSLWAVALMFAFAMLQWADGTHLNTVGGLTGFPQDLYFSGTTFFTLGLGDTDPIATGARIVAVWEAGTGFAFLAVVISYLPTLYGAFSERETNISLLDARAGSPPTAGELLRRHGRQRVADGLGHYLRDWEAWSAQLMESHLTFPVLCFFRSQHDNQSWVAALAAILDTCALLIAYGEGETKWQAQLTFATSRHAVADLSEILRQRAQVPQVDRLPPADLPKLRRLLRSCGVPGCEDSGDAKLHELRQMYEPYLNSLSKLLLMPLPSWGVDAKPNQETTVWGRITSSAPAPVAPGRTEGTHF